MTFPLDNHTKVQIDSRWPPSVWLYVLQPSPVNWLSTSATFCSFLPIVLPSNLVHCSIFDGMSRIFYQSRVIMITTVHLINGKGNIWQCLQVFDKTQNYWINRGLLISSITSASYLFKPKSYKTILGDKHVIHTEKSQFKLESL